MKEPSVDSAQEFVWANEMMLGASKAKEAWVLENARVLKEVAEAPGATTTDIIKARLAYERIYWAKMERENAEARVQEAQKAMVGVPQRDQETIVSLSGA